MSFGNEATRRKVLRAASVAHQTLAVASLLALMFLIPNRAPGNSLGSRFRDADRVPVRIQPMVPAGLIAAASEHSLPH